MFWLIGLYETMNNLKLCVGQCDLFHGPVILLNISNTIRHIYIIHGLMGSVELQMTSYYRQVSMTYISWLRDFGL